MPSEIQKRANTKRPDLIATDLSSPVLEATALTMLGFAATFALPLDLALSEIFLTLPSEKRHMSEAGSKSNVSVNLASADATTRAFFLSSEL